jgi:hypothetical protein
MTSSADRKDRVCAPAYHELVVRGRMRSTRHLPRGVTTVCFRKSRYREERTDEARDERLWDLFYRETERSEPPVPVAERNELRATEPERDEVPAGAER